MNGISLQEITARQLQAINSGNTFPVTQPPTPSQTTLTPATTTTAKTTTAKKRAAPKSSKAANTAATTVSQANLQEIAYRLFLYTKSTWTQFKSLQETKKRQIFDSVSFLQTVDAEFSKYQVSETAITNDSASEFDLVGSGSLQIELITLNVKTAQGKNQSFPLKVPSTAKVSDILAAFTQEYPNQPTATRVIFDGDVLKLQESIEGTLEDDDMIEIK